MSQPELLKEGVYKQGQQVIVVLPSDKVVIIEEIPIQPPTSHTVQASTLQKIQDKVHSLFESKPAEAVVATSESATSQIQAFFNQDFDIKKNWANFKQCWRNFDNQAAFQMTQFKRQYVLPVGEIPVRSVCMAVSTGLVYAVFGRRNRSLFSRTRNLAVSFLANGVFWLPESFNPFLFRQNRI